MYRVRLEVYCVGLSCATPQLRGEEGLMVKPPS